MRESDDVPSIRKVTLKPDQDFVATYRELRKSFDVISAILESEDGTKFEVAFRADSVEAEILTKALRCVKRGVRISIYRSEDQEMPLRVRIIPDLGSKKGTRYLKEKTRKRLAQFTPPGKPPEAGVEKVLDIAESRDTIIAIAFRKGECWSIECNKMKHFGKNDEVYCQMLQVAVSKKHCLKNCAVAEQLRKFQSRMH